MAPHQLSAGTPGAFRHEALLYAGDDGFLAGTLPFIRGGVEAGEPVLVVVAAARISRLRERLGGDAGLVHFADMAEVGTNPARIIPAWREFVAERAGPARRVRGIGEPIWAERSPDELVECQRHESLLNVAFAGAPAWWLMCPYDTSALGPAVIEEARRSHPFLSSAGASGESGDYRGLTAAAAPFDAPLPAAPRDAARLTFEADSLALVRQAVVDLGARLGLNGRRTGELTLAANEVATNSLRHAGGRGLLRIWADGESVICEVSDGGRLDRPLAGRERPGREPDGERGLWLANQLCDLVQVRSSPGGTTVRLHVRRG